MTSIGGGARRAAAARDRDARDRRDRDGGAGASRTATALLERAASAGARFGAAGRPAARLVGTVTTGRGRPARVAAPKAGAGREGGRNRVTGRRGLGRSVPGGVAGPAVAVGRAGAVARRRAGTANPGASRAPVLRSAAVVARAWLARARAVAAGRGTGPAIGHWAQRGGSASGAGRARIERRRRDARAGAGRVRAAPGRAEIFPRRRASLVGTRGWGRAPGRGRGRGMARPAGLGAWARGAVGIGAALAPGETSRRDGRTARIGDRRRVGRTGAARVRTAPEPDVRVPVADITRIVAQRRVLSAGAADSAGTARRHRVSRIGVARSVRVGVARASGLARSVRVGVARASGVARMGTGRDGPLRAAMGSARGPARIAARTGAARIAVGRAVATTSAVSDRAGRAAPLARDAGRERVTAARVGTPGRASGATERAIGAAGRLVGPARIAGRGRTDGLAWASAATTCREGRSAVDATTLRGGPRAAVGNGGRTTRSVGAGQTPQTIRAIPASRGANRSGSSRSGAAGLRPAQSCPAAPTGTRWTRRCAPSCASCPN